MDKWRNTAGEEALDMVYCAWCGEHFSNERAYFDVEATFKSGTPPLKFSEKDLAAAREGLEELVREIEKMSEEELQDQVFVHLKFRLCARCKKEIVARIRKNVND